MASMLPGLVFLTTLALPESVPWHHPLYLSNGGVWRQRIPLVIVNRQSTSLNGTPVTVPVGSGENEAPLAGARIDDLRVCNERGDEMLFAILDERRRLLTSGRVPAEASLVVPAECSPHAETRLFVYFDNPGAWGPPDFLEATGDLRNGDVEEGEGETPTGWAHDSGDADHRASWTSEEAHTGRWCLKLEVKEGAQPSWISTRQAGLRIVGGARYRMTAWVKASRVKGYAGWYIHLGNLQNNMIEAPMLSAGDGTYDWKQVSLEFTAPQDADRASLGTVLWGTGTAWFDDVALELLGGGESPTVRILAVERLTLREVGSAGWPDGGQHGGRSARTRIPIRLINLRDEPWHGLASAGEGLAYRLRRASDTATGMAITDRGKRLRHYPMGGLLLFETSLPPRSVLTVHAYPAAGTGKLPHAPNVRAVEYAQNPAVPGGLNRSVQMMDPVAYAELLGSMRNLARNASFEAGEVLPDAWTGGAEGERPAGTELGVVSGGLFGRKCVRTHVPHGSTRAWTGWRQDIPVKPNRTYLYAAWLRCENLEGGAQLHVHLRKENGELAGPAPMQSAGPAINGTTGWTLLSGLFRTPEDCRIFQVHLTMLASGTVWHDGVVVMEIVEGEILPPETQATAGDRLMVWSVNPIVKVFREDPPPARTSSQGAVVISCAGNEYEPVQLAVRSPRDLPGVRVVVDTPRSASGAVLRSWEIGVVGYVPVDSVTNYFSDRTPPFYRKLPKGPPGSDGWPGWWPDPILPRDRLDLKAGRTQAIWLTLYVPSGTPRGEYRGRIRLIHGGRVLWTQALVVRVRGFALPDRPSLKAIYDCRQSGPMWRVAGKTEQQSREDFWRFMAKRRLCPDTIRPEPVFSYRDGQVTADFTEFDRAARVYFDELKLPHAYMPWHFYLFGWGHLPGEKFGEKPYEGQYPYEGVDRSRLRPEYRRAYQASLKLFWDHVKAMGWADRFVLYISDEPHDDQPAIRAQMSALCDMIHEVDPAIPIYCSTWHHQPEWDGKLNVWGIGHYGIVPVSKMEELRAGGARIWWTTDGQMCTDTPLCAIERLLPHYCFKYGAEAYEFWGVDWLTYDPYRFGWHAFLLHDFGVGQEKVYVRYPNGDGFLAYPPGPLGLREPVPSIRIEQAREGVEDYEYLVLLRELVAKRRANGKNVRRGEEALRRASELVTSPCEIGRYSTRILPDPDKLLRVRDLLAEAIEELSH